MGDAENALPPSKKRAAGRELSRDNPGLDDEEDSSEQETGTFKKASDEVLATRRMVKIRRNQTTSTPSSNPFAAIRLVPSNEPNATVTAATTELLASTEKNVSEDANKDAAKEIDKEGDENSKQSESKNEEPVAEAAACSKPEKGEDESSKQSESKSEPPSEAAASSEPGKGEDESSKPLESKSEPASEAAASSEPGKGEDESNKQSESKSEPASEAAASSEPGKGQDESNKQSESKSESASEAAADKEKTEDKENGAAIDEPAKSEVDNGKTAGVDKTANDDEKDTSQENADSSRLSSFGQLSSSQNAFTGLAGTGFSASTFSFGSKDGSALSSGSGSVFGQINNGNSSLFNTSGTSIISKSEGTGFPAKQEVVVETGEENEKVVFSADSVLFEFLDGSWKERGKGELKVNVSTAVTGRARLLMRARGNYRLILNASLYPDMKLTNMDKKGITFACINSASEVKDGLSTFALKFKDASIVEEFRAAVMAHKDKTAVVLKTPENSPNATDD